MNGALTRDDIVGLFSELSESLRSRGIRGHVYIVGGAAMILGFRRERTTHDVDARIENDKEAVLAAVAEVAEAHQLRPDWLNENATLFMPHGRDTRARTVFNSPHLVVTGASAEHLLAMKLDAARDTDEGDIQTLLQGPEDPITGRSARDPPEDLSAHAAQRTGTRAARQVARPTATLQRAE